MNLYLRLLWVLLRGHVLAPLGFGDTLVQRWRVLPNDIDVNPHMNNGRYLTMVDLGLVEFFTRTGFLWRGCGASQAEGSETGRARVPGRSCDACS